MNTFGLRKHVFALWLGLPLSAIVEYWQEIIEFTLAMEGQDNTFVLMLTCSSVYDDGISLGNHLNVTEAGEDLLVDVTKKLRIS